MMRRFRFFLLVSGYFVVSCAGLPEMKEPPPIKKSGISDEIVRLARDIEEESIKVKLTVPKARTHYEKALDYIRRAKLIVQESPHPLWDRSFLVDELDEIEAQIKVLARRGVLDIWKRETVGEDPDRLIVTEILARSGVSQDSLEKQNRLYALYRDRYSKYPLQERLLSLAREVTEKERNYVNLADIKGAPGVLLKRYLLEVKRNLEAIVKDRKATQEVDYRLYQRIEKLISYVGGVEERFGVEVEETAGVSLPRYRGGVFAELGKLSREMDMVNRAFEVKKVKKDPPRRKEISEDDLIEKARSWR